MRAVFGDTFYFLALLSRDKEWTLTDCVSFVVMEQMGILDALTRDRHFAQAGYRALFRSAE